MGRAGVLRSVSPGVAIHTAPSLAQVVAVDLDEGLNGLVSYRMQVGMPRMDFLINSSSGVVVTTTELDRERIAEYQLRVVASDAGTPTKSSTSTLTIRGESDGGTSCYMLNTRARAQPGQCQPGWREPYVLLLSIIHMGTGCLAHRASSSTGAIQHSRAFPVSTKSKTPATLLPPGRCLQCPRAGGQWPGPPASVSLFDPGNSRERGGALAVTSSLGRSQGPSARHFIWRCKRNLPLPHRISVEGHDPTLGRRQPGFPDSLKVLTPWGPLSTFHLSLPSVG